MKQIAFIVWLAATVSAFGQGRFDGIPTGVQLDNTWTPWYLTNDTADIHEVIKMQFRWRRVVTQGSADRCEVQFRNSTKSARDFKYVIPYTPGGSVANIKQATGTRLGFLGDSDTVVVPNCHSAGTAIINATTKEAISTIQPINPAIFGKWRTKYGGNSVDVRREADQIIVVITSRIGTQTFSAKAIVDKDGNVGRMTFRAITPGDYASCETQRITDSELDLGCTDAKDPTSGADWSAVK
jgi:hypothetical protein